MPEGYTHLRCAWRAARAQKLTADLHREAFFAGANGPDMLYCYQVWKPARKRAHPLPDLGERMHNENTGAFLRALLDGAKTPVQRSYAAGFLCHYAADTVVHPYVVLVTSPGQAYEGPGGHGYFEIALDSRLHESDTGDAAVPVAHCCPRMDDAALDEVIPLLAGAIEAAYGERYPEPALRDAFAPEELHLTGLHTGLHLLAELRDPPPDDALRAAAEAEGVRLSLLSDYDLTGGGTALGGTLVLGYGSLADESCASVGETLKRVCTAAWESSVRA